MQISCKPLKKTYLKEVNAEIAKYADTKISKYTEEDLASLPEPVKKYLRYCGYIGKDKIFNAQITWANTYLRRGLDKDWMKIDCYQFNSTKEPMRIAYMNGKTFGLRMEGRDIYQDAHGNMHIKIAGLFTVGDDKGREMDESALVTVLAEALFVPGYINQSYIKWTSIDENTAGVEINYNGIKVGGIFHFNALGECTGFETNDRNQAQNGKYEKIPWTASCGNYKEVNGIKIPTYMSAKWHQPNGDFEYYKGEIVSIKYNLRQPITEL